MWRISFWSGLLAPVVDALSEEKVPSPPRHLMAMWIRDAWELISEDDIKAATQAGYFPAGLAFANLLDTEYFGEASSDSSDSEASNPPSNPPSPSQAGSSEGDSDGTSTSGSGSGLSSHASQTAIDSDVSSLTSADSGVPSGVKEDSGSASDTEIVWAKSAHGVWGLTNVLSNGKLCYTPILRRKTTCRQHRETCAAVLQHSKEASKTHTRNTCPNGCTYPTPLPKKRRAQEPPLGSTALFPTLLFNPPSPPSIVSVCAKSLQHIDFSMYIGPPNGTAFAQGCDETELNQRFGQHMENFFLEWLACPRG